MFAKMCEQKMKEFKREKNQKKKKWNQQEKAIIVLIPTECFIKQKQQPTASSENRIFFF